MLSFARYILNYLCIFVFMNKSQSTYRPGVTVVIPVYNRARQIAVTVADILAQSRLPEAIVLVDNASTDNTPQVLAQLADAVREKGVQCSLLSESCPGAPAARNRGLGVVDTEWVMFFDSDDNMLPRHIQRAMEAASASDADVVGWDVMYAYRNGKRIKRLFETRNMQYHNLMHATMATQRYMTRTGLVHAAGGWDNNIRIWDDIEFGARILKHSHNLVKVKGEPQVIVNQSADSISGFTFASRAARYAAPLQAIAKSLGPEGRSWVLLKAMILAGDMTREGSPLGKEYRDAVLASAGTRRLRMALRLAYAYQSRGGRATARIFHYIV